MILEIEIAGKKLSDNYWLELGLPECLHHCLDGTRMVYLESTKVGVAGSETLRKIFRFNGIDRVLTGLESAYASQLNNPAYWEKEYARDRSPGSFLCDLSNAITTANWPVESISRLSRGHAEKVYAEAQQHIKALSKLAEDYQANTSASQVLTSSFMQGIDSDEIDDKQRKILQVLFGAEIQLFDLGANLKFTDMLRAWLKSSIEWCLPVGRAQRPGRGDFEKRVFCRRLALRFPELFGSSRASDIAAFASAVYDATGEDFVYKIIQRANLQDISE